MGIASDYSQLMQTIGAKLQIPPVQDICIAPFEPDPKKSSRFGVLLICPIRQSASHEFQQRRNVMFIGRA